MHKSFVVTESFVSDVRNFLSCVKNFKMNVHLGILLRSSSYW